MRPPAFHQAGYPGRVACRGVPTSLVCTSGGFSPGWTITTAQAAGRGAGGAVPPNREAQNTPWALRPTEPEVAPPPLGRADDPLAWITHLQQRRDRGLVGRHARQEGLHLR